MGLAYDQLHCLLFRLVYIYAVCMYVCMQYVCLSVYVCLFVRTYVCIYIHTHTVTNKLYLLLTEEIWKGRTKFSRRKILNQSTAGSLYPKDTIMLTKKLAD